MMGFGQFLCLEGRGEFGLVISAVSATNRESGLYEGLTCLISRAWFLKDMGSWVGFTDGHYGLFSHWLHLGLAC
jgi:hypothetical protein